MTRNDNPHGKDLLIKDEDNIGGEMGANNTDMWRSPTQNDVFVNKKLARVMKLMAKQVGNARVTGLITNVK